MLFISFIVGASVGSFLCLVVERGESGGIGARSRCTKCLQTLAWYEMIPIISWIVLRARCRTCGLKLSVRYVLWEIGTGLLFVATWLTLITGLPATSYMLYALVVRRWFLISIWLLVVAMDIKSQEIPIVPVAIGIVVALATSGIQAGGCPGSSVMCHVSWSVLAIHLATGILGAGFYYLQYWISKGAWVGEGDIWLGAFIGVILGWPLTPLALMIAYMVGAMWASLLILFKKAGLKSQLALAPFLAIGVVAAWWWGPELCRVFFYTVCKVPELLH